MKKIKKILIIDDDEMTSFLHKRFLESMQVAHEIICINDPYQALEYMHQHYAATTYKVSSPDLVFLDINMPTMSGFQFLEELESSGIDYGMVSIVMLTTSIYFKDRERAASFGNKLQGYLVKPLQKEAVHELLEGRKVSQ
ncbi:response regulator [Cesiribacter sp. SM1]|uniref:response regulator n=1 Tax=Cesiribacter sp. SM1 TaxID=2861196 RepID=UPI001CD735C4|nr:response regulator [Cesiribacter sp. SM1]